MDIKTIIVVVFSVVLMSFVVWSIGLALTSTQSWQNQVDDLTAQRNSLQTQVTSLQNQVTSLNTQLAEEQKRIENLDLIVTVYYENVVNFLRRHYPENGRTLKRITYWDLIPFAE